MPSQESAGAPSLAEELTAGRFSGVVQFWSRVVALVEVQRSMSPAPPARLLDKIISKPSRRRIAVRVSRPKPCCGSAGELSALTGSPALPETLPVAD